MFSKELQILDRNTIKYMIDELKQREVKQYAEGNTMEAKVACEPRQSTAAYTVVIYL